MSDADTGVVDDPEAPASRLDLDEIERKARAATQEGPWEVRVPDRGGGIEGVIVQTEDGHQIAEAFDSTPWSDAKCIANGEYIATASPSVVLALIARIRELAAERDRLAPRAKAADVVEVELAKLLPLADAAETFVDEQGKRVDGQYGLADASDFALDQWRDLVRAVEGAGR